MRGRAGAGLGGFGPFFGGRRGLARARAGPGWCGARRVQGWAVAGQGRAMAGAGLRPGEGPGGSRGGAGTARSNLNVFQPKRAQNNGKIQTKMA
jgi:hypothetical protein